MSVGPPACGNTASDRPSVWGTEQCAVLLIFIPTFFSLGRGGGVLKGEGGGKEGRAGGWRGAEDAHTDTHTHINRPALCGFELV